MIINTQKELAISKYKSFTAKDIDNRIVNMKKFKDSNAIASLSLLELGYINKCKIKTIKKEFNAQKYNRPLCLKLQYSKKMPNSPSSPDKLSSKSLNVNHQYFKNVNKSNGVNYSTIRFPYKIWIKKQMNFSPNDCLNNSCLVQDKFISIHKRLNNYEKDKDILNYSLPPIPKRVLNSFKIHIQNKELLDKLQRSMRKPKV